jgi:transposase
LALGLELTDDGFDFSVLSEFRVRLLTGGAEEQLLTNLLELAREQGWLKAGGKQRTDSTHIIGAVRQLNRLEIVGEALHHVLNVLAQEVPTWLQEHVPSDWWLRYSQRFSEYRFPKSKEKQKLLAETIGQDGFTLLMWLEQDDAMSAVRQLPPLQIMRRIWIQQFSVEEDQVRWRDNKNVPPAATMIASPYDTEVRLSQKRGKRWTGYKVHLTETCEIDAPHLITHVETTAATIQDGTALPTIQQGLREKVLQPAEHFVDGAYQSAELLLDSRKEGTELVGPMRPDNSWQAQDETAYDVTHFTIDWEEAAVTCPQGKVTRYWKETYGTQGQPIAQVVFKAKDCRDCPTRMRCTRSPANPRYLTFHRQERFEALQTARKYQQTNEFKERYKQRAGVEGTISQAVAAFGMRRSRYRGLAKTHLHHVATATAINLMRLVNWIQGKPLAYTRVPPFALLAPAS